MASLNYEDVFSRFYTKVKAYDFIYESLSDDMVEEFMISWLHSAISYPYIRRLFSIVSLDDDAMEFEFTLQYPVDEFTDSEFVTEVLSYAMIYSWLEPKVKSVTNIYQNFTTSDEKYFSQAAHLSELRGLCEDCEIRIRGLIRDQGYLYNPYLDGTTPLRRQP